MGFIKCPRCELNFIREEEQYCPVCKREMRGEEQDDYAELCSICNENPVMPGKDVCYACYKEMSHQNDEDMEQQEESVTRESDDMEMSEVDEMEDLPMDDINQDLPAGMGEQLSLEEEQSKEAEQDDEDEEDE